MTYAQTDYHQLPANRNYYERALIDNMAAKHQAMGIAMDCSNSMDAKEPGSNFSNIELLSKSMNMIGSDRELAPYKSRIDVCILQFSDNVRTVVDWTPMSLLECHFDLKTENTTSMFEAVIQLIMAVRARIEVYKQNGIESYRPPLFIYTDGSPTDPENFEEARALCERYVYTHRMDLTFILLPGASTSAIEKLDGGTHTIKKRFLKECTHGLPAAAKFITNSIVSFNSSMPGAKVYTTIDPYIGVEKREVVVDDNGNYAIEDTVSMVDNSDIVWGGRA